VHLGYGGLGVHIEHRSYAPPAQVSYLSVVPLAYVAAQPAVVVHPPAVRAGEGWHQLEYGRPRVALHHFAAAAASHPRDGKAKVGYALSAALDGDIGRAVWALRRAFRIDPYRAGAVELQGHLRHEVDELADAYEPGPHGTDADQAFLSAALHQLSGEPEAAAHAAHRALELGDHSPSTTNLAAMLEE